MRGTRIDARISAISTFFSFSPRFYFQVKGQTCSHTCTFVKVVYITLVFSPSDSTLTLENVTRVIASVIDWDSLGHWMVPKPKLDQISEQYTDKEQRMAAMVREWLESSPNVSWAILAEGFYCDEEKRALEEVKGYLQKQQGTDSVVVGTLILHC